MSGLETLALVCNIFQVITFSRETLNICKAVYDGRSPDAQLLEKAASLASVSAEVQAQCLQSNPQIPSERSLSDIAAKCSVASRALQDEVQFLANHQAQGNLAATLRIAVKIKWRKGRLDRLEKSLNDYQNLFDTQMLMRVWYVIPPSLCTYLDMNT